MTAVCLLTAATPAAVAHPSPKAPRGCGPHPAVSRSVHRLVAHDRIAGAAVLGTGPAPGAACARWTVTDGVAELRGGRPMNATDRLRVGSVTKTFTATVVLRLAAERRLSLDAPVARYLPGLIRAGGYDGRRITVRQLLRHTSGLPDYLEAPEWEHPERVRYRHFEPRRLIARARCADVAAPRDPETYWRDLRRAGTGDRLFAPVTHDINPCAFWDPPREPPTAVRADRPALLVNATGDPRTTYQGARQVHRGWPGSRLVTQRDADQHALYGVFGSPCVDGTGNAYLATGRLPAGDVTCARPAA